MTTTNLTSRSLVGLRRLARDLRGVGLSVAWVAGVGAAGAVVSMRKAYPRAPHAAPGQSWPPARPVPEGRLVVAVVLGASGSVITDAFGPYEVFARSPRFFVYTVSASRPTAMLSGGLAVVSDYSFADVDDGLAPEPDVVVVPAVVAPNGKKEAPLREWMGRCFTRIVRSTLVDVSDVTCGLKGFRAEVGKDLFARLRIPGWSFDAETLFLARRRGCSSGAAIR